MIEQNQNSDNQLMHPIGEVEKNMPANKIVLIFLTTIILGIITGLFISGGQKLLVSQKDHSAITQSQNKAKGSVGIQDKKTFKDHAEGVLREGGIDGEGQFHLERKGGESQNVYLTSTTVNLSEYLDKNVRVWGETFQAEKAGWLMDVGLVEIL